jgi:peptidoglycan hydrolase-like protein with peptidoglycan-binding domain
MAMKTERKKSAYSSPLRRARELRGWSQEELARQVSALAANMGHQGVMLDVSTISRWERGLNTPGPFYRQLLCSLFDTNARELGLLPGDSPTLSLEEPPSLPLRDFSAEATLRDLPSLMPQERMPLFRRRRFLLMLLAGATLGGGVALTTGLLQLRSAGAARHWPVVAPDIHEKLMRVRVIQWMLLAHGIPLSVDGVFWTQTENALMLFQEDNGLNVTPDVGDPTWEKLILPSKMTSSQIMDRGSQVKALQEVLNSYNASSSPLQIDGDFGPLTTSATRHFQQTHGLAPTGQADLNTWCVLVGGHLSG